MDHPDTKLLVNAIHLLGEKIVKGKDTAETVPDLNGTLSGVATALNKIHQTLIKIEEKMARQ